MEVRRLGRLFLEGTGKTTDNLFLEIEVKVNFLVSR